MVKDSHHWLNVVVLFPLKLSGFFIFSREVLIRASSCRGLCHRATAICSPTSQMTSSGVIIVVSIRSGLFCCSHLLLDCPVLTVLIPSHLFLQLLLAGHLQELDGVLNS